LRTFRADISVGGFQERYVNQNTPLQEQSTVKNKVSHARQRMSSSPRVPSPRSVVTEAKKMNRSIEFPLLTLTSSKWLLEVPQVIWDIIWGLSGAQARVLGIERTCRRWYHQSARLGTHYIHIPLHGSYVCFSFLFIFGIQSLYMTAHGWQLCDMKWCHDKSAPLHHRSLKRSFVLSASLTSPAATGTMGTSAASSLSSSVPMTMTMASRRPNSRITNNNDDEYKLVYHTDYYTTVLTNYTNGASVRTEPALIDGTILDIRPNSIQSLYGERQSVSWRTSVWQPAFDALKHLTLELQGRHMVVAYDKNASNKHASSSRSDRSRLPAAPVENDVHGAALQYIIPFHDTISSLISLEYLSIHIAQPQSSTCKCFSRHSLRSLL
jgi:hypothetical protein